MSIKYQKEDFHWLFVNGNHKLINLSVSLNVSGSLSNIDGIFYCGKNRIEKNNTDKKIFK